MFVVGGSASQPPKISLKALDELSIEVDIWKALMCPAIRAVEDLERRNLLLDQLRRVPHTIRRLTITIHILKYGMRTRSWTGRRLAESFPWEKLSDALGSFGMLESVFIRIIGEKSSPEGDTNTLPSLTAAIEDRLSTTVRMFTQVQFVASVFDPQDVRPKVERWV